MKKQWQIITPDDQAVINICKGLDCSKVFATILANRNILTPEHALTFLNSSFKEMRSPFSLKDMDLAVRRIYTALNNNEKILIFGDYDVDGISATSILLEFFQYIGADVTYYIPHRIKEGYGLQPNHITEHALQHRIDLIITVDCGSSSHDAVRKAKTNGIDVIITDHHNISNIPSEAVATINPKRDDCSSGLEDLSGVGVAFYLLVSLRKYLREKQYWKTLPEPNLKNACDLVALGTIADIVPLLNENRIFTKAGVDVMSQKNRPGINALLNVCNISKPRLGSEDIAFRLAPKLNVAGRIDHAKHSVDLLTTANHGHAEQIARSLNKMNKQRQEYEKTLFNDIIEYLDNNPHLLKKRTIVLAGNDWHEGVIGIVASKMVNKFIKPVVLISKKDGVGKGSARSIPEFDLYEGLSACSEELVTFGGHYMAAGLQIKTENINRFIEKFEEFALVKIDSGIMKPESPIDYELDFDEISDTLIDELESLQPFGPLNHEPVFLSRNIRIISSKIVGENHRRMQLNQPESKNRKVINAIHFNVDTSNMPDENFDQIVFKLRWNHWNSKKTAQILIEET